MSGKLEANAAEPKGVCSKNCDRCHFRGKLCNINICNYIFYTGKPRPCPAGDGCTVKVSVKVRRRKPKALSFTDV